MLPLNSGASELLIAVNAPFVAMRYRFRARAVVGSQSSLAMERFSIGIGDEVQIAPGGIDEEASHGRDNR